MPGFYLAAILLSTVGMVLIDHRFRLEIQVRALLITILAVEVLFLAFDLVGAARGWFASNPAWVVAIVPPGIPPEEPLLLAFLATFSVVLVRAADRWLERRRQDGPVDGPGRRA